MSRGFRAAGIVAALTVLGLIATACSGDESDHSTDQDDHELLDWTVEVTDDALGVVFEIPEPPQRIVQPVALPDGTPSELVIHTVGVDGIEMYVSSLRLDPDDYELGVAAAGAAEAVGGELVVVRPVTVDGRSGRDGEITYDEEGVEHLLFHRAVLLPEGLLQLQTLGPADRRASVEQHHQTLIAGVDLG